jgi:hypothetical protein
MLANVLKTDSAIRTSIRIIEIFVKLRESLTTNKDIIEKLRKLEAKALDHDEDLKTIFEYLTSTFGCSIENRI